MRSDSGGACYVCQSASDQAASFVDGFSDQVSDAVESGQLAPIIGIICGVVLLLAINMWCFRYRVGPYKLCLRTPVPPPVLTAIPYQC